jgi:hypothetical protein
LDEIKIFFPSLFLPLPEGSRGPEKTPLFRPGDQIQGRVLQQLDARHFSLLLGGRTVVVESNVSLPLSADLLFRVEETGPRTLLKWLPPEGPEETTTVSFLKKALAADIPLEQLAAKLSHLEKVKWMVPAEKETWKQFLKLFHRFSLSDLQSRGPHLLEKLFFQSGFFWESKVQQWIERGGQAAADPLIREDLKGLALKLLHHLKGLTASSRPESGEAATLENLKRDLGSFLQKIELYQILNLRPSDSPDRFFLFLPLWLGNHLQFVEFNLSLPREKPTQEKGDGFSVLFLLNLPHLGKVRIEVQIKEKDLFCRFVVSEGKVSEFLKQNLPLLRERMEKLGFQPSLQMSTGPPEREKEMFLQDLGRESQALLSVII